RPPRAEPPASSPMRSPPSLTSSPDTGRPDSPKESAMPLTTGDFTVPTTELGRIADRVRQDSVLATLSPERPTLFGNVSAVRMSRKPRAQIVAEGAQKTSDTPEWASVVASPIKFQTTVRMTEEVRWLDQDHRLQIVDELVDALGE